MTVDATIRGGTRADIHAVDTQVLSFLPELFLVQNAPFTGIGFWHASNMMIMSMPR
jgi:hypothetical protein